MPQYFVYFLTNKTNDVLYTGMTNNLERRLHEHRRFVADGFTKKYNATKLVYFETYDDPVSAISREKQIKNWRREKKDFLINLNNSLWDDLSLDWQQDPSATLGMTNEGTT